MKRFVIAAVLALVGANVNAEMIASFEGKTNTLMMFEDRIGCPPGTMTFGTVNRLTNRVSRTGCWVYEPLNVGNEITLQFHNEDRLRYFDVSKLTLAPNFENRAMRK